jgi:hypothetical protein
MGAQFLQSSAVEAAPLEDEAILFQTETSQFCILNRTSSIIWFRVAQPATAEEIAAEVRARFEGVTESDALRDVEEVLQQMIDLQLVTRV